MGRLSRLLMMGLVVCAVMVVAGLNAQAATVHSVIDGEFVSNKTPIVFEDNDFGLWIDKQSVGEAGYGVISDGDLIIGIIRIQEISAGGGQVAGTSSIKDISPTTGTDIGGAPSSPPEVTAVFGGEITDNSPYVNTGGTAAVWALKPIAGGSITFSASLFSGLTSDWTYTFNTAGNMVDLWEDSGNDFDELDPSTAGNGTFSGGLGFSATTEEDPDDGTNGAGEFWFVRDSAGSAGGTGDGIPDTFELNLSLVDYLSTIAGLPSLFGYAVGPNDVAADPTGTGHAFVTGSKLNFGTGGDMYASGLFNPGQNGWTFNSDGDFKVLFVPLPTAVWPAMLLLGALGLVRRSRRKTA